MTINKMNIWILILSVACVCNIIQNFVLNNKIASLKESLDRCTMIAVPQIEPVKVDLPDGEHVTKKTTDGSMIGIEYYIVKDGELMEVKPL